MAILLPFHLPPAPVLLPELPSVPEERRTGDITGDFETLRARGRYLIARGWYREASTVYSQAARVAIASGEPDLTDEARCGWGAAETELGNGGEVMPELRRVLLSSAVDHNRYLAAYTLARAHELAGQVRKALFYGQLSLHHSSGLERPELAAGSHNVLGNLVAAEGREADAATEYRRALRLAEGAPSPWIAKIEGNLGYCLVASAGRSRSRGRAQLREGLRLLYASLRTFRRANAVPDLALAHLDLCFAHLELKRPSSARRHGEEGLALAERLSHAGMAKKCLYLLGQTAVLEGDTDSATRYFAELEHRFYPDRAGLSDILLTLDLRQVLNLRASEI